MATNRGIIKFWLVYLLEYDTVTENKIYEECSMSEEKHEK